MSCGSRSTGRGTAEDKDDPTTASAEIKAGTSSEDASRVTAKVSSGMEKIAIDDFGGALTQFEEVAREDSSYPGIQDRIAMARKLVRLSNAAQLNGVNESSEAQGEVVQSVPAPSEAPQEATESGQVVPQSPDDADEGFRVLSFENKVVEQNDSWHKVSWILTLENMTDHAHSYSAEVQFFDGSGFKLDYQPNNLGPLPPYSVRTFRGYTLLETKLNPRLARIGVEVKER
jgi:hypothetical protein